MSANMFHLTQHWTSFYEFVTGFQTHSNRVNLEAAKKLLL